MKSFSLSNLQNTKTQSGFSHPSLPSGRLLNFDTMSKISINNEGDENVADLDLKLKAYKMSIINEEEKLKQAK